MVFIHFLLMGFFGSLLYVLLHSRSWAELASFASFRHVANGLVFSALYYMLWSEYAFPNFLMCLVFSYFGPDLVEAFMERLRKKAVQTSASGE